MKQILSTQFYTFLFFLLLISSGHAGLEDFDVSNNQVSLSEFRAGGPVKDGIPALTDPQFILADEAGFIKDYDMVIGIFLNGKSKAYPIEVLNWHEIVNDHVGDKAVVVTWCPLTKSGVTFDRNISGEVLEFGVSGMLYKSNVVMYDRNHDGLWTQLGMKGLTGTYAAQSLKSVSSELTTWKQWKSKHPSSLVMTRKTGYVRMYDKDPYAFYHESEETMFPVSSLDDRLLAKSLVLGVEIEGVHKAYALDIINRHSKSIQDTINGKKITIHKNPQNPQTAWVTDQSGNVLPGVVLYWFAWSAFNPDTDVY